MFFPHNKQTKYAILTFGSPNKALAGLWDLVKIEITVLHRRCPIGHNISDR